MSYEAEEEQASTHADRVLALIEESKLFELTEYLAKLERSEMAWLILALAQTTLAQESENDSHQIRMGILKRQNETLDNANANLFREKRELALKVQELRDILHHRDQVAA